MLTNPEGSISISGRFGRTAKNSRSFSPFFSLSSEELREDGAQYQRAAVLISSWVHSNSLRSWQNLESTSIWNVTALINGVWCMWLDRARAKHRLHGWQSPIFTKPFHIICLIVIRCVLTSDGSGCFYKKIPDWLLITANLSFSTDLALWPVNSQGGLPCWTKLSTFLKQNEFNHISVRHIAQPSQTSGGITSTEFPVHSCIETHTHARTHTSATQTHRSNGDILARWLDWLREYEYAWV